MTENIPKICPLLKKECIRENYLGYRYIYPRSYGMYQGKEFIGPAFAICDAWGKLRIPVVQKYVDRNSVVIDHDC